MASGTVTTVVQTFLNTKECVVLTLEENDVYASKKFGTIEAAEICLNSTSGTTASVTFTGGTAKVHGLQIGKQAVTLTLYGK